jgi:hypothetical protein
MNVIVVVQPVLHLPYVDGGWEVDIRVLLPNGAVIRERRKAPTA